MWLLDRFFNPFWYRISRLDNSRRRTIATALCCGDFLRQQVDKKLVGPAEVYVLENPLAARLASAGLTFGLRTKLVDQAILGLLRCCRCPPFDPGRKLPREAVDCLPELWGSLVLADINHRLSLSAAETLEETHYSEDPEEAQSQVLTRWAKILGIADVEFASRLNAEGFVEAWNWFVQMFFTDTLEGMAIIPDKMLFSQARRLAAETPPHRAALIDRFMEQLVASGAAVR